MTIEGIESKVVMPTPSQAAPAVSAGTGVDRPVIEVEDAHKQEKKPFEDQEQLYQLQDVSPEKIKKAVDDINQKIKPTQTLCQFSYHDATHRISITVKDAKTGDVIREIPPEKTLDMIAKAWELAGLMVDEKR